MNYTVIESWLHFFTYLRNICAHHARLWNRSFAIKPIRPHRSLQEWNGFNNNKLSYALVVINEMLLKMPKGVKYSRDYKKELEQVFVHANLQKIAFYTSIGFNSKEECDSFFNI